MTPLETAFLGVCFVLLTAICAWIAIKEWRQIWGMVRYEWWFAVPISSAGCVLMLVLGLIFGNWMYVYVPLARYLAQQ